MLRSIRKGGANAPADGESKNSDDSEDEDKDDDSDYSSSDGSVDSDLGFGNDIQDKLHLQRYEDDSRIKFYDLSLIHI